ncbi:MAG: pantoate--beta-alanine ligase [Dehalococcoidales bacterium]|nr:pantoate--beta-alanine ligase [Dehalococcoidales bacterium]MDD5604867.1 pantoate--beta-alanine ligase [Dehalococcoidales bacterium]MDX9986563.1 pantoate--beta-alanine ligase [Dehalococcoidales bacterium]NLE90516.1 pantoate--beta-alanine ligase [Dehalococcoidales bacterium]
MITVRTIEEYKKLLGELERPIGLVPTMGSLHEGHLSLVKAAKASNHIVVVSVFVNPTQFSPDEDYERYPRDIERDSALLEKEGVDILFAPNAAEMYAPGYDTWVEVGTITERLEGAARPGHFRGVATIVLKLFNIIAPQTAYFGQKDAQQALVIKKMVRDLNLDINIVTIPIVRSFDGLALSSRNKYLSPEQKTAALAISASLKLAEKLHADGVRDAGIIKERMKKLLNDASLTIDYISIAAPDTLKELETISQGALVSLAAYIGSTRLIDNTLLSCTL